MQLHQHQLRRNANDMISVRAVGLASVCVYSPDQFYLHNLQFAVNSYDYKYSLKDYDDKSEEYFQARSEVTTTPNWGYLCCYSVLMFEILV